VIARTRTNMFTGHQNESAATNILSIRIHFVLFLR